MKKPPHPAAGLGQGMRRFAYDCGAFLSLVLCGALFAVEEPPAYQQTDAKDQKHGSQPIGGTGLDQGHGVVFCVGVSSGWANDADVSV